MTQALAISATSVSSGETTAEPRDGHRERTRRRNRGQTCHGKIARGIFGRRRNHIDRGSAIPAYFGCSASSHRCAGTTPTTACSC